MKLPKKIQPDRIKDSIVEVIFTSQVPPQVILGLCYSLLDESYKENYITQSFQNNGNNPFSNLLFTNNVVKFEIRNNSIVLNCDSSYPGWEIYFLEIRKVFEQLSQANIIQTIQRVGVRYVSEYIGSELKDITQIAYSFGMPDIKSDSISFRSEFKIEDLKAILNLSEEFILVAGKPGGHNILQKVSRVDVDVYWEGSSSFNSSFLFDVLDRIHTKEKAIFFGVLKTDFFQTLNAEY